MIPYDDELTGIPMSMFISLKKHFQPRSLEWFSSFVLLAWGAYLILHPSMFSKNPSVWNGLAWMANQPTWGLGAFCAGAIGLVALYINGTWTRTPAIRVAVRFMSIFVWFFVSVGLWNSGIDQTGVIIYPAVMVADMVSCYRAAADAYEAEVQRRLDKVAKQRDTRNVINLRDRSRSSVTS